MTSEHIIEEWRPVTIPGFEADYEISSFGRVKRVKEVIRKRGRGRIPAGRILAADTISSGYQYVSLYCEGRRKGVAIHRLVALAFIGAPPPGHEVCHNDGTRSNNSVSNLRWGTRSENQLDRRQHGTDQFGEKNPSAKLNFCAVEAIKFLHSHEWSNRKIAKVFNVSEGNISSIICNKTWSS